jgi:hypothetical protein
MTALSIIARQYTVHIVSLSALSNTQAEQATVSPIRARHDKVNTVSLSVIFNTTSRTHTVRKIIRALNEILFQLAP